MIFRYKWINIFFYQECQVIDQFSFYVFKKLITLESALLEIIQLYIKHFLLYWIKIVNHGNIK